MELRDFKIIFEKLSPAVTGESSSRDVLDIREIATESDEIAELSQLAADLAAPEPQLFTTS